MSKSLVPIATLSLAILTGVAAAAASSATGTISTLDTAKHQLKLSNGQMFMLPTDWRSNGYKVGDKVTVSYKLKNGAMDATRIVAVK